MKRIIHTHHAASAIIAFNGWQLGFSSFSDAANFPAIQSLLRNFYNAINNAVCSEYGIAPDVQREFSRMSMIRLTNPQICDTIERNIEQPLRQLGPDEKIALPLKLLLKYNFNTLPLCRTAAAAVLCGEKNEPDWGKRFGIGQAGMVFSYISKITDKTVIGNIDFAYNQMKTDIKI